MAKSKKPFKNNVLKGFLHDGGEGGIRTLGRVAPTLDFESSTFDHSATSPDSVSFVEAAILSGAACTSPTQGLHHHARTSRCARITAHGANGHPSQRTAEQAAVFNFNRG